MSVSTDGGSSMVHLPGAVALDPADLSGIGLGAPFEPRRRGVPPWRLWVSLALIAGDLLAVVVACVVSYLVRGSATHIDVLSLEVPAAYLALVAMPAWLLAHAVSGSYQPDFSNEGLRMYRAPVVVGLRSMAVVAIASWALDTSLSRLLVIVYFPTLIVLGGLARFGVRRALAVVRAKGRAQMRLLVVGDHASLSRFAGHLHRDKTTGYVIVGVCMPDAHDQFSFRGRNIPVYGTPDTVVEAAGAAEAQAVAVASTAHFEQLTLQRLAWAFERSGVDLLVAPDVADVAGPRIRIAPIMGMPLLHITEPRSDGIMRRAVSVSSQALAVPLLVLLLPLLLVVALIIKLDDGGPVFYRQQRIGRHRRPFHILKFRTMVVDAEARLPQIIHLNEHDGALFKIRDDPRVTRVGRWLRKYSIDELPQLFNVVRGDMMFVGPRPVLERETALFGTAEERRFQSKPGMTGLWQVSGRADLPWEDAVKLDLYYVENWSPILDFVILCRTLRVVLGGTGS
ncbi:MAG TPA: sugar transferase [Acidimicrobiales bacterium]|nr:sugar transferase [Acidimicrobiales bacterium]